VVNFELIQGVPAGHPPERLAQTEQVFREVSLVRLCNGSFRSKISLYLTPKRPVNIVWRVRPPERLAQAEQVFRGDAPQGPPESTRSSPRGELTQEAQASCSGQRGPERLAQPEQVVQGVGDPPGRGMMIINDGDDVDDDVVVAAAAGSVAGLDQAVLAAGGGQVQRRREAVPHMAVQQLARGVLQDDPARGAAQQY